MDATTMIVMTVALNCTHARELCRVFTDPAASRAEPAVASTKIDVEAPLGVRMANALRERRRQRP